jgi:hypothetical protein
MMFELIPVARHVIATPESAQESVLPAAVAAGPALALTAMPSRV